MRCGRPGRDMAKKKTFLSLTIVFVFALSGILVLLHDSATCLARKKFDQVEIGMTRGQVRSLMDKTPQTRWASLEFLDTWDFEDGFCMWVIYGRAYCLEGDTARQQDSEDENWRVSNVSLTNLSEERKIQKLLIGLGLSSRSRELTKP
jgi:hypothetical protein